MNRNTRTLVAASLALLAVTGFAVGGVLAAPSGETVPTEAFDGTFTEAALDTGGTFSSSVPDRVETYGASGDPGFYISVENGSHSTLDDWANASEDREVLAWNNDSNRALVRAPPGHVGVSFVDRALDRGLAGKSYVTGVDVEISADVPADPPGMAREDYETPVPSLLVRDGSFEQQGVAYSEDANKSLLGEARATMNATGPRANGSSVTVAVLDTGLNTAGGDLYQDRIAAGRNFVTDKNATDAGEWSEIEDGNGHGSWVASAIAANVSNNSYDGVAPNATLVVGKTLADDGGGSIQDIIEGLEWACGEQDADVVSMSLGSPQYSATLAEEVRECAVEENATVVVAAGNSRQTVRWIASPADTRGEDPQRDGVITVAATNVTDNASDAGTAYFSMVGPDPAADGSNGASAGALPTVAAPGMRITAPVATESGTRSNATLSGTSMATPLVSGVVASRMSDNTSLKDTPGQMELAVGAGATPMPGAGYTEAGAGMVDLDGTVVPNDPPADYYEDQQDARTDTAAGRDAANRGLGGPAAQFWQSIRG
jgi:hypothetical protein